MKLAENANDKKAIEKLLKEKQDKLDKRVKESAEKMELLLGADMLKEVSKKMSEISHEVEPFDCFIQDKEWWSTITKGIEKSLKAQVDKNNLSSEANKLKMKNDNDMTKLMYTTTTEFDENKL